MNRALVALACLAACGVAQAMQVPSYSVRVDVAGSGPSSAALSVRIEDAAPGTVLLPVAPALKPSGALRVDSAPPGAQVKAVTIADRPLLEIALPEGVAKSVPLAVSFPVKEAMAEPRAKAQGKRSLPAGSLLLDHDFVNTQPMKIGSYRVQVVLPDGARVQEIREQSPKTKRTEVEPRVRLNAVDGRQGALLQLGDVRQGDRAAMSLEVVPDKRGFMWLLVGLALSIAYLIGFRDLVSRRGATDAA